MFTPLAYLNGRWISAAEMAVPVHDAGFVQGVTVAEQLRTFGGRIFRLREHLARLGRSLELVGLSQGVPSPEELAAVGERLVECNRSGLAAGDELGLSIFVTPGPYAAFAPRGAAGPTVGGHTYPVPFASFAEKYETGQALRTTTVVQVPAVCWPAELKCRSRMHYYLSDREAAAKESGARALLCDAAGDVCEASTANIVAYFPGRGLVSPPREAILPGISLDVLKELAAEEGIPFTYARFTAQELGSASECLLTSTSPCVLPAVRLDGRPMGDGRPGPVFRRLLARWSKLVGVEIAAQARQFAARDS